MWTDFRNCAGPEYEGFADVLSKDSFRTASRPKYNLCSFPTSYTHR
jgi:hypothetical protein